MISRFGILLAVVGIVAAPVLQAAENYDLRSPVLGYVLDAEAGTMHPVDGIPGASQIGSELQLSFVVVRAAISPTQDYAIVQDAEGAVHVVDLTVSPPSATHLSGALAGTSTAMISPMGRRAALYYPELGKVQYIEGVPSSPRAGSSLHLAASEGQWTSFAISDRGIVMAASIQASGTGSIYAFTNGSIPLRIGSATNVTAMSFLADSSDAVVADAGSSQIVLYRDVVGARQAVVLATEEDRIVNPFGVGVTDDSRYVAVGITGGVASIPVLGGPVSIIQCNCDATELAPLSGDRFRLTSDPARALQVAEIGHDTRVSFVPALQRADDLIQ